jgi:hypothetical protein
MNETEKELLACLRDLEKAVQSMSTANPKPNLVPIFLRLDALTAQLSRGADPDLFLFLHKRSYEKARLFLEGRDSENAQGTCRHG